MTDSLDSKPTPDDNARIEQARQRRADAADTAAARAASPTRHNGEINDFPGVWPTNFSKGLPHDVDGVVDAQAFCQFVVSLNTQDVTFSVPLGPRDADGSHRPEGYPEPADNVVRFYSQIDDPDRPGQKKSPQVRNWESPAAGHVYDLEGPDAGGVAMAPAPKLGASELCAELAEVYAAALLRDVPFADFDTGTNAETVQPVLAALNRLAWFDPKGQPLPAGGGATLNPQEQARREARFRAGVGPLRAADLFRGSAPGAKDGPFVSQFMLIGNAARAGAAAPGLVAGSAAKQAAQYARGLPTHGGKDAQQVDIADGLIQYGAQSIKQKILPHKTGHDYMCAWPMWLDVQNGADVRGADDYDPERFITTPRDLASYVHFDQLYQAYLNACLLLLAFAAPEGSGFPSGRYHTTRGSFATFGGPHVLSLVTEVATRALKAVRRQKFNHHLRARPEALAALVALVANEKTDQLGEQVAERVRAGLVDELHRSGLLELVHEHNRGQLARHGRPGDKGWVAYGDDAPDPLTHHNYLLPMAFPEGSPMHPAYGAGHATVAGACVTVLKAFFELYRHPLEKTDWRAYRDMLDPLKGGDRPDFRDDIWWQHKRTLADLQIDRVYRAPADGGDRLMPVHDCAAGELTLIGELNKLAANISIGRNMAGVHYYSDYYDSLRMGERVAAGMLQEQLVSYPENVTLRFEDFDGHRVVISNDDRYGASQTRPLILVDNCVDDGGWWNRHLPAT